MKIDKNKTFGIFLAITVLAIFINLISSKKELERENRALHQKVDSLQELVEKRRLRSSLLHFKRTIETFLKSDNPRASDLFYLTELSTKLLYHSNELFEIYNDSIAYQLTQLLSEMKEIKKEYSDFTWKITEWKNLKEKLKALKEKVKVMKITLYPYPLNSPTLPNFYLAINERTGEEIIVSADPMEVSKNYKRFISGPVYLPLKYNGNIKVSFYYNSISEVLLPVE